MRLHYELNPNEIVQKISSSQRVCIFTHKNPDGDAIGSSLALANVLKQMAIQVDVLIPNEVPDYLRWIPSMDCVSVFETEAQKCKQLIQEADLLFFLDFSVLSRIDDFEQDILLSKAYKIHIDHHPEAKSPANIILNYTQYSSTAELLYWFLSDIGFTKYVDKTVATCLYVGISTDTGNFNHNASVDTFKCVAELLSSKIDRAEIQSSIYDNYSFDRMKLLGYCLQEKLEYFPEYNTAIIAITKDELERFKFQVGDTEGFVNYPLSIKGVRFTGLFIEHKDIVKISLRSKGTFAVNKISEKFFNGGGHKNAAGGYSEKSIEETLTTFRNFLTDYADELKA